MSEYELGRGKTGGRQKGTPNKRNQEINNYAAEKGVSPAMMLIDILAGEKIEIAKEPIDKEDVKWAIDTLMPYMYGKRKPVDSEGNDSHDPLSDLVDELRSRRS